MNKKLLQIEQMETKMKHLVPISKIVTPSTGWIKAVRTCLGMSLQQFASKLSITKQSAREIEEREQNGSLTIRSLRESAKALDMELVYGLVPKDGSLNALIERKARELAIKIVNRTSQTMKLEDQQNTNARIRKAIKERSHILKEQMPKALWD